MSFIASLLGGGIGEAISAVTEGASSILSSIDELVTSDEEMGKIKVKLEQLKLDSMRLTVEIEKKAMELQKQQIEINKINAASSRFFDSGWRPWIGWGLGTMVVLGAFMNVFVIPMMSAFGVNINPIAYGEIIPIITGLLGLVVDRTYQKRKGIAK